MITPKSPPTTSRRTASGKKRFLARAMFYSHLWLGVIGTLMLLVIAVTGIALNHKRALGLMPDVNHTASSTFTSALSLSQLVDSARNADPALAAVPVDRMDVRPDDGIVKVRFDDREVTEVIVDLTSGDVVNVGHRNDVFLEKLHSGEIFGDRGILIGDAAAVITVVLLISGYWLWLYPKVRR